MSNDNSPTSPPKAPSHFHKVMVFFCRLGELPDTAIWLLASLGSLVVGIEWSLLSGDWGVGGVVTAALVAFMAADAALLRRLPARGVSFGPWKAQLLPLALLRLAAAALVAPFGLRVPWSWAVLLALTGEMAGTVLLYRGAIMEPRWLRLTTLPIRTDRMPPTASPVRILHVSDIHLERPSIREEQLLEIMAEAQPDVILITGDYANISFHRDPQTHRQIRDLLGRFPAYTSAYAPPGVDAPRAVFAVLGSPSVDLHDVIAPLFDGLPVTLIRHGVQDIEVKGQKLALLGLDCSHVPAYDAARLSELGPETIADRPSVLLYHSPELMPQAIAHGIDLYLCGHTHGGQVRLPVIGPLMTASKLGRRYVMGHYRQGRTNLYVSRGIGFEGLSAPRVRLLCPPEVTLITLSGHEESSADYADSAD